MSREGFYSYYQLWQRDRQWGTHEGMCREYMGSITWVWERNGAFAFMNLNYNARNAMERAVGRHSWREHGPTMNWGHGNYL